MMCDIKDKISIETGNMTFEELMSYIKAQIVKGDKKLIGQESLQLK